jgi:hypothetical protein
VRAPGSPASRCRRFCNVRRRAAERHDRHRRRIALEVAQLGTWFAGIFLVDDGAVGACAFVKTADRVERTGERKHGGDAQH